MASEVPAKTELAGGGDFATFPRKSPLNRQPWRAVEWIGRCYFLDETKAVIVVLFTLIWSPVRTTS